MKIYTVITGIISVVIFHQSLVAPKENIDRNRALNYWSEYYKWTKVLLCQLTLLVRSEQFGDNSRELQRCTCTRSNVTNIPTCHPCNEFIIKPLLQ